MLTKEQAKIVTDTAKNHFKSLGWSEQHCEDAFEICNMLLLLSANTVVLVSDDDKKVINLPFKSPKYPEVLRTFANMIQLSQELEIKNKENKDN